MIKKSIRVKRHVADHKINKTRAWLQDQALDSSELAKLLKKALPNHT
jgi:hypothetical protein